MENQRIHFAEPFRLGYMADTGRWQHCPLADRPTAAVAHSARLRPDYINIRARASDSPRARARSRSCSAVPAVRGSPELPHLRSAPRARARPVPRRPRGCCRPGVGLAFVWRVCPPAAQVNTHSHARAWHALRRRTRASARRFTSRARVRRAKRRRCARARSTRIH